MSVVGTKRRRFLRAIGLLVAVPALCGGTLGLVLVAMGVSDTSGESSSSGHVAVPKPKPIRPIAIPARACPYLETVHAASAAAHYAPAGKTAVEKLVPLELALRLAAIHVPEPLRLDLQQAADTDEALRLLTNDPQSMTAGPSLDSIVAGMGAGDDATHLVGTACNFQPPTRPFMWP
jgi:hypothetical protein